MGCAVNLGAQMSPTDSEGCWWTTVAVDLVSRDNRHHTYHPTPSGRLHTLLRKASRATWSAYRWSLGTYQNRSCVLKAPNDQVPISMQCRAMQLRESDVMYGPFFGQYTSFHRRGRASHQSWTDLINSKPGCRNVGDLRTLTGSNTSGSGHLREAATSSDVAVV